MILLSELLSLLEAPARVHVNGKLSVLADLIQTGFGHELTDIPFSNRCLIGQFVYTLHARTGLSVTKCIGVFLKRYIYYSDRDIKRMSGLGVTPQELIDIYDGQTVTVNKKKFKLVCSFHTYHGEQELAAAVEAGNPVIVPFPYNSGFSRGVENHSEDGKFHERFVKSEYLAPSMTDHNHSLLAVGVDRGSNELILRDMRSHYLYKGYVKVPFAVMKKQIPLTFSFDVDLKAV